MIFFISDTHFSHQNILKYCPNRVFDDIDHHDAVLIMNWNERVGKNDTVIHLGDFGFGPVRHLIMILNELRGKKVLIAGNHDKQKLESDEFRACWSDIRDSYHEVSVKHQGTVRSMILCHYPLLSWNGQYHDSIHLHGHIHSTQQNPKIPHAKNRMDVGVDASPGFAPYEKSEIFDILASKS